MWIIFKNLPRGITTREINKVALKGYKPRLWLILFFIKNVIKRSKIILIKDSKTGISEYHAIVQIDSPAMAASIIENLDGKTLNGILLKPHRYNRRFPSKDRRRQAAGHTDQQERRKDDRRRSGLVTQVLEIS